MKTLYWIWGLLVSQKMHGGHVAVVLQSASTATWLRRRVATFLQMHVRTVSSHAKIEHGSEGGCNLNPGSPFAFKGEIYKNLAILRFFSSSVIRWEYGKFFRDLVRVRNGSFVVPATPKTETLDSQFWLSLRRASLGFEGLEPALGGYQNQTPSGSQGA